MNIKITALTIILLTLFVFTGCLGPVSLDEYGYVVTIGAQKGESKRYYFTFALQRELSEPGTDGEGGALILACECDSIDEAVNELEGNVPYTLNFSRTDYFIFSREIAEQGAIEDVLSLSFDSIKIRPSASIVVSEGGALEFIGGLSSNNEANFNKLQTALMHDKQKTGMVAVMSVSRLFEAVREGCFDYSAAYGEYDGSILTDMAQKNSESKGEDPIKEATVKRIGGLKSCMKGAAIFDGWRMCTALDCEETMLLNMAVGEFENGTVTLPYERGEETLGDVTLILSMKSLKRSAEINDDGVIVSVKLTLSAGVHKAPVELKPEELDDWMTGYASEYISFRLHEVFTKCREAGSDAMRFGTVAVKQFRSQEDWLEFDWKSRYKNMNAVFETEIINMDKSSSGDLL